MTHPHSEHRPEWWNGVSLGNVITILGGIMVAAVAWGANEAKQEEQDRRIAQIEQRMDLLTSKAEQLATTQAFIRANVELLVRSQGLRPVDPAQ